MKHFLFCTLIMLSGITALNAKKYNNDGISFSYPSSWEVTQDEGEEDVGRFISVERKGRGASGLVVIVWTRTDNYSTETAINEVVDGFFEDGSFEVEAGELAHTWFGRYKMMSRGYDILSDGIATEGEVFALEIGERLYCVMQQGTVTDREENGKGFRKIEKSLKFR